MMKYVKMTVDFIPRLFSVLSLHLASRFIAKLATFPYSRFLFINNLVDVATEAMKQFEILL